MKVITFGEVMLRLAAPQNLRFSQVASFDASFGGGEANVAVSLANFGIPVEFVSKIPSNDIGESCLMTLKKYGVGTTHILRGGERRYSTVTAAKPLSASLAAIGFSIDLSPDFHPPP